VSSKFALAAALSRGGPGLFSTAFVRAGRPSRPASSSSTATSSTTTSSTTTLTTTASSTTASSSITLTTSAKAAPPPAEGGTASDINTLASNLSKGYSLSNCAAQNLSAGELAALTCGQSSEPSGPVQAKYILFDGADNLAGSFKASIKDDVLTACGDYQSPTTWHQGNSTTNLGSVACGTYQNAAEIIWTTDAKNVLSYIRAGNTDVPALYQWWRANG
jgi:hypothetical protein